MQITKNMKAGFQGIRDAMRVKAEKLLNRPGKAKDVYMSKSAADKEKMRAYKKGGSVKSKMNKDDYGVECRKKGGSMKKDKDCQKFAMGGVAKIRHDEATKAGMPKKFKKKSVRDIL